MYFPVTIPRKRIDLGEGGCYTNPVRNKIVNSEKYIRISGGKYCISFGAGCRFSGNVIGRIEKILGYPPIATMQYSTTSAAVLGLETICIHIFSK